MAQRNLLLGGIVAAILASGCSSIPAAPKEERAESDPWEPLNRQIDGFNRGFDKVLMKPVAKGYEFIIPKFMRIGVRNFSSNLRTPLNAIGSFLQGKGKKGFKQTARFLYNSSFGILGILDVATPLGFEKENEDFGQVFATWGIPDGPYIVIPILGPRTVRDAFSIPFNFYADPLFWYDNAAIRDKLYVLRLIDVRQGLLAGDSLLEGSADPYLTLREAYLQNRLFLIYDGNPPAAEDDYFDEFLDDEEEYEDKEQ